MELRVMGRCVQIQDRAGNWKALKWFRDGKAARRGLARRLRNPIITAEDSLKALDKAIENAERRERGRARRREG